MAACVFIATTADAKTKEEIDASVTSAMARFEKDIKGHAEHYQSNFCRRRSIRAESAESAGVSSNASFTGPPTNRLLDYREDYHDLRVLPQLAFADYEI